MYKNIKSFFSALLSDAASQTGDDKKHSVELIMAALMVEMARADRTVTVAETDQILSILEKHFTLSPEEQTDLLALAEDHADHATSLFEFTTRLKQLLPHEEREALVELLWRVAFADGVIDKYEEQLVRKVAELLHVRHQDFIAAKHRADPTH
ncbi:MAG: TerB family tellurite resistance protein [Gammaproteobacteria bacterium]|nr:MAG: TerB family tellurite resistance protein [Gammaproteobacteria bacterium]